MKKKHNSLFIYVLFFQIKMIFILFYFYHNLFMIYKLQNTFDKRHTLDKFEKFVNTNEIWSLYKYNHSPPKVSYENITYNPTFEIYF